MSTPHSLTGRVQPCGCIALPEELQQRAGLYPGARYTLKITEESTVILLRTLKEPAQPADPALGVTCG